MKESVYCMISPENSTQNTLDAAEIKIIDSALPSHNWTVACPTEVRCSSHGHSLTVFISKCFDFVVRLIIDTLL